MRCQIPTLQKLKILFPDENLSEINISAARGIYILCREHGCAFKHLVLSQL